MPLFISINWPSLVTLWVVVQKIYPNMYLVSCTNTHRDVTNSVNHGMVTKTWISWERNRIFLRNKKILNLCLRWHILRSYRFVAEITFDICQFKFLQYKVMSMYIYLTARCGRYQCFSLISMSSTFLFYHNSEI